MEAASKDLIGDDVAGIESQQQAQGTAEDDKKMDPWAADIQYLLKLLPEEIWRQILENVDNSRDYSRICEASPIFHDLLSGMRIQALFPEVLKIMMAKVKDKDRRRIIHPRDLSSLRQVCHSWKKGVDHLLLQPFTLEDSSDLYEGGYFTARFFQLADFQRFQAHFASTHSTSGANPFPRRSVEIYLAREPDAQAFYLACLDLLESYGKHIWHIEIQVWLEEPPHFYAQLKLMLSLLPNLKSLQLSNETENTITISEQELQSLVASPSPALPDLTQVWYNGLHSSVIRHLLFGASSRSPFRCLGLVFNDEEEFRQFFATPLPMQTRELWLAISDVVEEMSLNWSQILSVVETQFGETLTHLGIELPYDTVPFLKEDRLTLPKLKKLNVQFYGPVPLGFLLGLESTLEKLRISIALDEEGLSFEQVVEDEDDIQLYSHFDQLERSNIWEKLPQLKGLDLWMIGDAFIRRICTRSMWKEWITKNQTV